MDWSHNSARHNVFLRKNVDLRPDERTGDVICRECGAVLGEHVHCDGVTWNSYNNDESMYSNKADPNRVGEYRFVSLIAHLNGTYEAVSVSPKFGFVCFR